MADIGQELPKGTNANAHLIFDMEKKRMHQIPESKQELLDKALGYAKIVPVEVTSTNAVKDEEMYLPGPEEDLPVAE